MEFKNSQFSCTIPTDKSPFDQSPVVQFLSRLLQFIQGTLRTSQTNVVEASRESPIHGMTVID